MKKVYLIGAGPGRADLITVRGMRILGAADVIIYDYLVDKSVLSYAKDGAELYPANKLTGKSRHIKPYNIDQEKISGLVVKKVREGKKVVRLKGGDPAIFARTNEEMKSLLSKGIQTEIVPGITAASLAAARLGIALTDRDVASTCVFASGIDMDGKKISPARLKELCSSSGTIIFYMSIGSLKEVTEKLIDNGKNRNTPVVIVQSVGRLDEKVVTGVLSNIAERAVSKNIKPPSIVIIGEAAGLFNPGLLKAKQILFTGLCGEKYFEKYNRTYLPLIKIMPAATYASMDKYIKRLGDFDWVIFTSKYSVFYFFDRMRVNDVDIKSLYGVKIASIGKSTAREAEKLLIKSDIKAKEESSEGLIKEFRKININNKKIFIPRSSLAGPTLSNGLRKMGAKVIEARAYRNIMPADLPGLDLKRFKEIVFTSPSTVKNFVKRYGKIPEKIKISSIGKRTRSQINHALR